MIGILRVNERAKARASAKASKGLGYQAVIQPLGIIRRVFRYSPFTRQVNAFTLLCCHVIKTILNIINVGYSNSAPSQRITFQLPFTSDLLLL